MWLRNGIRIVFLGLVFCEVVYLFALVWVSHLEDDACEDDEEAADDGEGCDPGEWVAFHAAVFGRGLGRRGVFCLRTVSACVWAAEHGAWCVAYTLRCRMSHRLVSWCAAFEGCGDLFDAACCASGVYACCPGLSFCECESCGCGCSASGGFVAGCRFVDAFGFCVYELLWGEGEFVYGLSWVACGLSVCEASAAAGHPAVGFFG